MTGTLLRVATMMFMPLDSVAFSIAGNSGDGGVPVSGSFERSAPSLAGVYCG